MRDWQRKFRERMDEVATDDDDEIAGKLACGTRFVISEDYTQAYVRDSNGMTVCVSVGKEPLTTYLRKN